MKPKDVRRAFEGVFTLAAEQVKKTGSFNLRGMLKFKLKVRPATKARKGVNPFTKEPCVFKAKPASKTVKVTVMGKLKRLCLSNLMVPLQMFLRLDDDCYWMDRLLHAKCCLLYTSPSPRDGLLSRMPSSA